MKYMLTFHLQQFLLFPIPVTLIILIILPNIYQWRQADTTLHIFHYSVVVLYGMDALLDSFLYSIFLNVYT